MTRKQAILRAIDILSKNKKYTEIVESLQEILDEYPNYRWTKKSIIDSIEQFKIEHNGKIPLRRDMQHSNLPTDNVIKYQFNVKSVSEFFQKYFEVQYQLTGSLYDNYTQEEYYDCFKRNYLRIGGGKYVKRDKYDTNRERGTPTSGTIIMNTEAITYLDLIGKCGLPNRSVHKTNLSTSVSIDDSNNIIKSMFKEDN